MHSHVESVGWGVRHERARLRLTTFPFCFLFMVSQLSLATIQTPNPTVFPCFSFGRLWSRASRTDGNEALGAALNE